jgi:hypothetical protein
MPSPTFIIPGASRSGTSTIWFILRQHPEICTPSKKELRFFDQDKEYEKGISYYESLFGECEKWKEIGESSPPYWYKGITFDKKGEYNFSTENDAPKRIKKHYPNIKLIFSLRNPVDRIYSQFWKNVRQGRERTKNVIESIKEEMKGERKPQKSALCWLYKNSYATHLRQWIEMYNRDNIKVIIFEEWTEYTEDNMKGVFDFLGVGKNVEIKYERTQKNKSRVPRSVELCRLRRKYLGETLLGKAVRWVNQRYGRPSPTQSEREWLFEVLEDEIKEMEKLLGRSLSIWEPEPRS